MATTVATTGTDLERLADEEFRSAFRGELIAPGDARYDEARKVYNAMIDRRPGLIARCVDTADVPSGSRLSLSRKVKWTGPRSSSK